MKKDFNTWNIHKQEVHNLGSHKLYHEREVWWCSLGTSIGFEQDGTGKDGERPVLIVKGFSAQVCIVLPLTTSAKRNPYYVEIGEIGGRQSFVITSQIRLIDTRRLVNKIEFLESSIFAIIRKTIRRNF